jgi:hypothetical protein
MLSSLFEISRRFIIEVGALVKSPSYKKKKKNLFFFCVLLLLITQFHSTRAAEAVSVKGVPPRLSSSGGCWRLVAAVVFQNFQRLDSSSAHTQPPVPG